MAAVLLADLWMKRKNKEKGGEVFFFFFFFLGGGDVEKKLRFCLHIYLLSAMS